MLLNICDLCVGLHSALSLLLFRSQVAVFFCSAANSSCKVQ